MSRIDTPRLAILGAGPVGLEAAIYAAHLQLPFRLYERGQVGEHLWEWGHVRFGIDDSPIGTGQGARQARQELSCWQKRGNHRLSRKQIVDKQGIGKMKVGRMASERYHNPFRSHTLFLEHVVLYIVSSQTGLDQQSIWDDLRQLLEDGLPFIVVINDKQPHSTP